MKKLNFNSNVMNLKYMKIIIDGQEIPFTEKPIIHTGKPENTKSSANNYQAKDWCRLIAFLINSDFLALRKEPKLLTANDVWESNPNGELAFLFNEIKSLEQSLYNTDNEFVTLCFDILNGKDIQADKKYASLTGLDLYQNIFPISKNEQNEIQTLLNNASN